MLLTRRFLLKCSIQPKCGSSKVSDAGHNIKFYTYDHHDSSCEEENDLHANKNGHSMIQFKIKEGTYSLTHMSGGDDFILCDGIDKSSKCQQSFYAGDNYGSRFFKLGGERLL